LLSFRKQVPATLKLKQERDQKIAADTVAKRTARTQQVANLKKEWLQRGEKHYAAQVAREQNIINKVREVRRRRLRN